MLRSRWRKLTRAGLLAFAWAAGRYLRHRGGSVYVRGGLGGPDFVPGLSDIDLAVVFDDGAGAAGARCRWERLRRAAGPALDQPRIYDAAGLAALAGESVLTFPAPRTSRETWT